MKKIFANERGFWGLVSLVLAAVISMLLFYWFTKGYFGSSTISAIERNEVAGFSSSDIPAGPPPSVLEHTRAQIEAIEKQQLERQDKLMQEAQQMATGE